MLRTALSFCCSLLNRVNRYLGLETETCPVTRSAKISEIRHGSSSSLWVCGENVVLC